MRWVRSDIVPATAAEPPAHIYPHARSPARYPLSCYLNIDCVFIDSLSLSLSLSAHLSLSLSLSLVGYSEFFKLKSPLKDTYRLYRFFRGRALARSLSTHVRHVAERDTSARSRDGTLRLRANERPVCVSRSNSSSSKRRVVSRCIYVYMFAYIEATHVISNAV